MPFDVKNGLGVQKQLKSRLDGADEVIAHDVDALPAAWAVDFTGSVFPTITATITGAIPAGTNLIGAVNTRAATSGGTTPYRLTSAATNNAQSVKASAGQVYGLQAYNVSAAIAYLKLYNKASAPAPGSDNALLAQVYPIPAGGGLALTFPEGMEFTTGIAIAIVAGAGDTDNTAIAAGDVFLNMQTK